MKRTKKILALSASLLFLVSMATGCGVDPTDISKQITESAAETTAAINEELAAQLLVILMRLF